MFPAVEVQYLKKSFGKGVHLIHAVEDLTLSVQPGEIYGLVGPDGAAKTTTIRMLCTVIKPDAGTARVMGHDVYKEKGQIRKKIGYLSQRFSLYGDLTISENIDFFAEIHGFRNYAARKQELLEFMRLDKFQTRLAAQLSGGMKQKLALACTLIHTPEIIFLDEPTTGVDPVSRRDFWWILSRLQAEGLTIFVSTPYLDEAERCHRVALMNKGKIIVQAAPQEIKTAIKKKLIAVACDALRQAKQALLRLNGVRDVQAFGDLMHVQVDDQIDPEMISQYLQKEKINVQDARQIKPSLEDAFIHYLKA